MPKLMSLGMTLQSSFSPILSIDMRQGHRQKVRQLPVIVIERTVEAAAEMKRQLNIVVIQFHHDPASLQIFAWSRAFIRSMRFCLSGSTIKSRVTLNSCARRQRRSVLI